MTDPHLLNRLSELLGVHTFYTDAWGKPREAPESTRLALLAALGFPADSSDSAAWSLARLEKRLFASPLPPVIVNYEDEQRLDIALVLLEGTLGRLTWVIDLEEGKQLLGTIELTSLPMSDAFEVVGARYQRRSLTIAESLPLGYHRLSLSIAQTPRDITASATIIRAPHRCYRPPSLEGEGRRWGVAIQLYNVRSERNWGIGDFTDLSAVLHNSARLGAGAVGVNPLHSLFPSTPEHASPYSPSSRLFLNVYYIDVEAIVDFADSEPARRIVYSHAFQERLARLRATDYVDYNGVADCKLVALEILYRTFRENVLHLVDNKRTQTFRQFQIRGGRALRNYAIYMVIAERAAHEGWGFGWQNWPEDLRRPESEAVHVIARENDERVEFYEYLQWQADLQMRDVKQTAERLGMSIGIYNDLAVGTDGGGSDAWDWQEVLVIGARAGAPPDPWNMKGQDWGLPPFHPLELREHGYRHFAELVRTNMCRGGALRIDHVIGLMRLYWIPTGAPATDGAYVSYMLHELLAVLALESQRARCLIVGEDLGTVPEGLSETLMQAGMLSFRVFYFEQESDGRMRRPMQYPREALIALSTHDLPTFPAYWKSMDIELKDRLDLWPTLDHRANEVALREIRRPAIEYLLAEQGLGDCPRTGETPVAGVYEMLARAPSRLLMVQLEDILGQIEQVNVPGTVRQYPNWRRKLSFTIEAIFARDDFRDLAQRLDILRCDRPSHRSGQGSYAVPKISDIT